MAENFSATPQGLEASYDGDQDSLEAHARAAKKILQTPRLLRGKKRQAIAATSAIVIAAGAASAIKYNTSTDAPTSPEKRVKIWDGVAFFRPGTPLEDEQGHTVMAVPEHKVLELQDFQIGYDYQTESRYAEVTLGSQRLRININNAEANGLIASAYVRKQAGRHDVFHTEVTVNPDGRVINPSSSITEINQGSFIDPEQIEKQVDGLVKPHGPPSPF